MNTEIEILSVNPQQASVQKMIAELDLLMNELYPAESNHLSSPEELAAGANQFYAAKVGGNLLGCGAILISDQKYAEVKRVYVDPSSRGLGLAKAILNRLEHECRLLSLTEMKLETGIHQPDAIKLFEQFGFTKCGAFGNYPEDDPYSYFMQKTL